jgi:hypothetical protein
VRIVVYSSELEDKRLVSLLERALPPSFDLEVLPITAFSRGYRKKLPGAFVYIDASGLGNGRLIEMGSKISEVEGCAWGVLDRGGEIPDPASLFFAGAKDYLGPPLLKGGSTQGRQLNAARLGAALEFARLGQNKAARPELPFPGWEGLPENTEIAVRFCYAAVAPQQELLERIGEKRLNKLREDFAAFLGPWSKECNGIVWIKEPAGSLVLFPPRDEGMNPVLAAFRLLLDRALVGYEVFRLEAPLSFRFAFHAGRTMWRRPGATGTIVSEDVNFVFHLGVKLAGDGLITLSTEAERSIPPYLRDLFAASGDFEGRSLLALKRFRD